MVPSVPADLVVFVQLLSADGCLLRPTVAFRYVQRRIFLVLKECGQVYRTKDEQSHLRTYHAKIA